MTVGRPPNAFDSFCDAVASLVNTPVEWVRENFVKPNQKEYYWYHRRFRRVPTIDECYTDDIICYLEANEQFKRDKKVDDEIICILRRRMEECTFYEGPDNPSKCKQVRDDYNEAATNHFIKYGDLGYYGDVRRAFMKQKHRMIWERRHGPVGSGMREEPLKLD